MAILLDCRFVFGAALTAGVISLFFLVDLAFGVSTSTTVTLSVFVTCLVFLGPALMHKRKQIRALTRVLLALAALSIAIITQAETSPCKGFLRLYSSIQPGMTRSQVVQLVKEQYPDFMFTGAPSIVGGEDAMGIICNPNDGNYNAEIIHLELPQGRVTGKRYSHD